LSDSQVRDRSITFSARLSTTMSRKAQWFVAAVAVLGLGLSGCAPIDLRGDSFREDELSATCQRLRPKESQSVPWGVSNKALQIEKDFGVQ
jgi:hypothetical protein